MIGVIAGEWEGLDGLGEGILRELKPEATDRVFRCVVHGQNELKKTLSGTRTGHAYELGERRVRFVSGSGASAREVGFTVNRGAASRIHIASAPGEPPAVLYGNLRNSVGHSPPRWRDWVVSASFGVGLGQPPTAGAPDPAKSYARRLELGGTDSRGVYIAPRPYMEPTVLRIEPHLDAILRGDA